LEVVGGVALPGLRRVIGPTVEHALVLAATILALFAFVPPSAQAADTVPPSCDQACAQAQAIANMPQIFAQACKAAGGVFNGNGCVFATVPGSEFGPLTFVTVAQSIFTAHLLEQARAAAQSVSQVSMSAVESALRDIRDRLQNKASVSKEAPQGLGAGSLGQDTAMMGLTRSPRAALPGSFGAWVQGYVDRDWRDSNFGFIDGRTTTTSGAIGGIDYTSFRVFSPNDALVVGLLAGTTELHSTSVVGVKTKVDGPSVGAYGVYVNGGFSVDFNSKIDFLALDQTSILPLSSDVRTYTTAANINYKIDVAGAWIEPTAGAIYTVTRWDHALNALDGHTVRVQGGVRFGQTFSYHGVTIEPTLLALLYSDVVIEGGNISTVGFSLAPSDEGRLFEQASLKLNFDFGNGLSSSIEGEVRHGDLNHGAEDVAVAGRVSLRYRW
jgi:hypothetical protein